MQRKAAAIAGVNGGVLRLVGVVHHAVFAVFDVGVYFHVIVGTEPAVQVLLIVCRPEDGTVQYAVVDKAVRQSARIKWSRCSSKLYLS